MVEKATELGGVRHPLHQYGAGAARARDDDLRPAQAGRRGGPRAVPPLASPRDHRPPRLEPGRRLAGPEIRWYPRYGECGRSRLPLRSARARRPARRQVGRVAGRPGRGPRPRGATRAPARRLAAPPGSATVPSGWRRRRSWEPPFWSWAGTGCRCILTSKLALITPALFSRPLPPSLTGRRGRTTEEAQDLFFLAGGGAPLSVREGAWGDGRGVRGEGPKLTHPLPSASIEFSS